MMSETEEYRFTRKIHRLRYKEQIRGLFDETPKTRGMCYYGKIAGIESRVIFTRVGGCSLSTKTEGGLEKAHSRALDKIKIPDRFLNI